MRRHIHLCLMVTLLRSLCHAIPTPPSPPPPPRLGRTAKPSGEPRTALTEDVNILMYGVLQFSQGLHDVYQSTSSKLTRIWHKQDINDLRVGALQQKLAESQNAVVALESKVYQLKEEIQLSSQTTETKKLFQDMAYNQRVLQGQVANLENVLDGMEEVRWQSGRQQIAKLKELSESHSLLLQHLQLLLSRQQDQLREQRRKLLRIKEVRE
ncbi:ANGL8 protein, partial [Polypterus senegalus]